MTEVHRGGKYRRDDDDVEYKPKVALEDSMPEAASGHRDGRPKYKAEKEGKRKYFQEKEFVGEELAGFRRDKREHYDEPYQEEKGKSFKPKEHYSFRRGGEITSNDWNHEDKRDQDNIPPRPTAKYPGRERKDYVERENYKKGTDRKDGYHDHRAEDRWKTDRYQELSPYQKDNRHRDDGHRRVNRNYDDYEQSERGYDGYRNHQRGDYPERGYREDRYQETRRPEARYDQNIGLDGYEETAPKARGKGIHYEEITQIHEERGRHRKQYQNDDRFYDEHGYEQPEHNHYNKRKENYRKNREAEYQKEDYYKEGYDNKGFSYAEGQKPEDYKQGSDPRYHGRENHRPDNRHHHNHPVRDFFATDDQPNVILESHKTGNVGKESAKPLMGKKEAIPTNPSNVKVRNYVTDSAQKQPHSQTPQLLRELEIPTRPQYSKINKNSQEFVANIPSLNFNVQNLQLTGMTGQAAQLAQLSKEYEAAANTNNYSNNTFSQTIFINPNAPQLGPGNALNPYMDSSQSPPANFGLTMPLHPTAAIPAAMMQQPLNPLLMQPGMPGMFQNPLMFGQPNLYMNQPNFAMGQMPYMNMMGNMQLEVDNNDGSMFDNGELTEEQIQFMTMFEMFKDTLLQDTEEEIERALQEQEFEKQQEEAEIFHPELKDCQCCHGYPRKCNGNICADLGTCHCALRKTKEEEEANKDKFYVEETKNCTCCKGFVYACNGAACKISGRCKCYED